MSTKQPTSLASENFQNEGDQAHQSRTGGSGPSARLTRSDGIRVLLSLLLLIAALSLPAFMKPTLAVSAHTQGSVNQMCSAARPCDAGLMCQTQKTACPGADGYRSTCAEQRCAVTVAPVPAPVAP